ERHYRHGEALVAIETIAAPQRHELLEIDTDFGTVSGKIVIHDAGIEEVDARGHRSVGGKNVACASRLQGLVEIEFFVAHVKPDLLQREEGRVAFIHVKHGGLEPHRLQGTHPTDSKHDFLADTGIDVAAVEGVRYVAILRQNVVRNVGIQQV